MMNKYQKALNTLRKEYLNNESKECDLLQELVDKATPIKAIIVHDYDGFVYECPNCHMEFRPDTILGNPKWEGCPYCLQKLK